MVKSIKKTLAGILVAGASLGLTGCDNSASEYPLFRTFKLYTSSYYGLLPMYDRKFLEDSAIDPSKVVVIIRDEDMNGKQEVTLGYEGKNYLMKTNSAGDVYLQKFELKPVEIKNN
jgi:hypothetical protein